MNVSDLLSSNSIPFSSKGADYIVLCINPEHDDSNPSMRIDQVTGIFNCFSCGYKGNLFAHFGEKPNQGQLRRDLLKKKIADKRAESVGLAFPEGAQPFDKDWRNIKAETFNKFEAFTYHKDEYAGRVVFPIRGLSGEIKAFIGRHTDLGNPKYKVIPSKVSLPFFPKPEPIKGSVVLVEGIFDMLNLYDKGLTNVIAAFGTSTTNKEKLDLLKMQGVSQLVIFMDNDEAGQLAAERIAELAETCELETRNIKFGSKDEDPGSLSLKQVQKLKSILYD